MGLDRTRESSGEVVGGGVVGVQVYDEDTGEFVVDVSGVEGGIV